jgi:hypothetical protein
MLASLVLAIKYNEDIYYSNKFYAKVGGVSNEVLNNIEIEFLKLIDFSLFIDEEIFHEYYDFIFE